MLTPLPSFKNILAVKKASQSLVSLLFSLPTYKRDFFVKIIKNKLPMTKKMSSAVPWSKDEPFKNAKRKVKNRTETMTHGYASWLERKGIVSTSQLLIPPGPEVKLFQDYEENHERLEMQARVMIDEINQKLALSYNLLTTKGRTIDVLCESGQDLVEKAIVIWG